MSGFAAGTWLGDLFSVVPSDTWTAAALNCGSRILPPTEAVHGTRIDCSRRPVVSPMTDSGAHWRAVARWGDALDATCWCERAVVRVPHADLLAGRTRSCGREACVPSSGPVG